jgi:peptidoglycan/xylan/chitin deacetylase (PgdA/CDA1 family)
MTVGKPGRQVFSNNRSNMYKEFIPFIEQEKESGRAPESGNLSGRTVNWLPEGKSAAVCFSIDDVHPGMESNGRKAGAAVNRDSLGHLRWLLDRHPQLRATLFTTADWRQISPLPTRRLLARIPYLRERFFLAEILPIGAMRLSNHPEFIQFLKQLPRVEIGLHGLHHVQRGPRAPVEFQKQSVTQCKRTLQKMIAIFDETDLEYTMGISPPGWEMTESLARAMIEIGIKSVSSARDIGTPISRAATTNMSGLKGVSLIYPECICAGQLLHITSNFQATSTVDRALEIIENGGLLAIKAHAVKTILGYTALDGLDELYRNYLDLIFTRLENMYGDSLWWTSMGELTDRCMIGNSNKNAAQAGNRS